nr:PAS domain S-box protein [uncultured Methanoregula sp.]
MDLTIIQSSVTLFQILCVIIVFASVFMRSRFFREVFEQRPKLTTQVLLMVFFGILSIFGTLSGLSIYGAVVNIRDLGPMAAGLLCGPYIGLGAGIIGGLFRFFQGGPYMWTGLSAPILSGLLGGIMYLANRRRFVSTWVAVVLIGLSETFISCYTLILVTKPSEFFTVVTMVAAPMVIFNIIGMFIFATVVHRIFDEMQAQKERQQLELEAGTRKNLTTIINTIAYPVYVLDRGHHFTLVNDSFCRFIERTRQEILGKTLGDFIKKEDSAVHYQMTEDVFQTRRAREEEITITRPNGQGCTIIATSTHYSDSPGQEFIVGVIQDITERRKMQVALAENEAWYRILFEHTGAATIIINKDGIIDQANTEFAELSGYSREEIEGTMKWIQIADPVDYEIVRKYHHERRQNSSSSAPTNYTVRILDRSGNKKTLQAVVATIPGTEKSIASYVDITEQKRTEEALAQANKKLNLLSSVTRHDIINQILVLKGFLTLLSVRTDRPELREYVNKSIRAGENIERQIIFTRDYQDMGVQSPVWQNVKRCIINAKGALVSGTISIKIDGPDVEVFADPLFEKVFYNLIDNSLKYGGEKLRTIRIGFRETDSGLVITYEDDGNGISEEDKVHLFERGFGKHTGLGLFLSREILSITEIAITGDGVPGGGARFEISVPAGAYRILEQHESHPSFLR